MTNNFGFVNEDEMANGLNNKKVSELSQNLKHMMKNLFGALDDEKEVTCVKTEEPIKPDIIIQYDGKEINVSLKSGGAEIVHEEHIDSFVNFLKEQGISKNTIDTILYFQFGDGTLDGTGQNRMPYEKLMYLLASRIRKANYELNSNKDFILKFVERCVFKGAKPENLAADYIYHGSVYYGNVVGKKELLFYVQNKEWQWYKSLHIGPLMIKPHARYVDRPIISEKRRHQVDVSWPKFYAVLDYISRRYSVI